MPTHYENFDLSLTWHEPAAPNEAGQVAVQHGAMQGNPAPYFTLDPQDALSILMSTNVKGMMNKTQLVAAGRQVADLLLPTGGGADIRAAFRTFWQQQLVAGRGVRLRIFYPTAAAAGGPNLVRQITQLLAIPWEYLYLPELAEDNSETPRHFLCRNPNISLAHAFKSPVALDNQAAQPIDRLLVDLAYLSWLGDDVSNQTQDQDMFNDFADELGRLNSIIDTSFIGATPTNFNTGKPPASDAGPDDVVQAILDNDLVHLVFHSEPSKIYLKNGQEAQLTAEELLTVFDAFQGALRAKAVILIGCNAGDGGRSLAAALHRAEVPLVVSFTASIKPADARNFVDGFYRAFAAHPNLDLERAVTNGRRLMFQISDDGLKWFAGFATPRLFLNAPDSVLVPQDLLFGSKEMVANFATHIDRLISAVEIKQVDNDLDLMLDWLTQRPSASFFVTGRGGIGKSTLIAKFIKRVQNEALARVIYHFCGRAETSLPGHPADPLAFIRHSLAPQLSQAFANYRELLPEGRFPLLVGNADQALRDFVLTPLRQIETPPLIVIDDIDLFRTGQGFENSILKLLGDQWNDLILVARFVIAADTANPVALAELEKLLGPADLPLIPERERGDVVQTNLAPPARDNVIEPLKAVGDYFRPLPLVYEVANRFGASLSLPYKIPLEVAASPQGVNALYQAALAAVADSGDLAQDLLDLAAIAYEPLYRCDLATLIGLEAGAMPELLNYLRPFFATIAPDQPLRLFHDSLTAYLRRDLARRNALAARDDRFVRAIQPQKGWAALTDWVNLTGTRWSRNCAAGDQPLSKQARRETPPATVAPRYMRRYLALHAYEAFRTAAPGDERRSPYGDNFLDLVCNPAFRTVRLVEGGQAAAVQDMRHALRVTYLRHAEQLGFFNEQAVTAIDQLLAINDPALTTRLLALEAQLRSGQKREKNPLVGFLGLAQEEMATAMQN